MRGRWLVLSVVATAACDDSIYIEVRTNDPAVTEVELVVGAELCTQNETPCDGVQPPGFAFHYPGRVYFHDPQDFKTPLVQKVDGDGAAWFKFAASAATVRLVALGRAGDARSAVVLDEISLVSGPLHVIADLTPVTQLGDTTRDRVGLDVWTTQAGETCIGAENTNALRVGRGAAAFIVPEGDTDCDDVLAANECDPFGYLTENAAGDPNNLLCVTHFPVSDPAGPVACMIGGASCNEANPNGVTCGTTNVCVPDAACLACQLPFDPVCIVQGLVASGTRLDCTIEVKAGTPGGPFSICDQSGGGQIAKFIDDSLWARNCTEAPRIARLDELPGFQTSTTFDTGNGHALTLSPINFNTKCQFDIKLEGEVDAAVVGTATPVRGAAVEFMLEGTSKTPGQDVILGMDVQFRDSGCLETSTCKLAAVALDDTVLNCLGAP